MVLFVIIQLSCYNVYGKLRENEAILVGNKKVNILDFHILVLLYFDLGFWFWFIFGLPLYFILVSSINIMFCLCFLQIPFSCFVFGYHTNAFLGFILFINIFSNAYGLIFCVNEDDQFLGLTRSQGNEMDLQIFQNISHDIMRILWKLN